MSARARPSPASARRPADSARGSAAPGRAATLGVLGGILLITVLAYWPAERVEFVNYDDNFNLTQNYFYRGLDSSHQRVMFTSFHMGVWQPLGWLGFALIYHFAGLEPRVFHAVSLVIHLVNVALIFVLARRLLAAANPAGARSRAQLIAAACSAFLAGVHPLRAEVVAWATAQPYLTAVMFLLLSVLAYLHAVTNAGGARRVAWLLVSIVLFALSLLCKSIGVSLPLLLLVLDAYPLGRLGVPAVQLAGAGAGRSGGRAAGMTWLLVEKLPYIVLAAATVVIASKANAGNSATLAQDLPLHERVMVAAYGAVYYLHRTLVPTGLIAFHRIPDPFTPLSAPFVASAVVCVVLVAALVSLRRRAPVVVAAAAAYLAILAPVLGLVQHGAQLVADRYGYLSGVPLALLVGAGAYWFLQRDPQSPRGVRIGASAIAIGLAAALTWSTRSQVRVWDDSPSLWWHALATDPDSSIAHLDLGSELLRLSQSNAARRNELERDAETHLRRAAELAPQNENAWSALGQLHHRRGEPDAARACFEKTLTIRPDEPFAIIGLGQLAADAGRFDEALAQLQRAVAAWPESPDARRIYADTLGRAGRREAAIEQWTLLTKMSPDDADAHMRFALALAGSAATPTPPELDRAIEHARRAVSLTPTNAQACANLGGLLIRRGGPGDHDAALAHVRRAVELRPDYAIGRYLLGTILARRGEVEEALRQNQAALELAQRAGNAGLAEKAQRRATAPPEKWSSGAP